MKSYLQGIIMDGVIVFATIVFMGADKDGEVGRQYLLLLQVMNY